MEKGMNRREFLQGTAATGTVMLAANLAHGAPVTPAATKVQIPEADKIIVTVITDNLFDINRLDYKIAKRPAFDTNPLDAAFHAEHGLSYHIETVVDGKAHTCLYDFGSDPRGVVRNIDLLKINLQQVEAFGLSHDHWDHEVAMVEVLNADNS